MANRSLYITIALGLFILGIEIGIDQAYKYFLNSYEEAVHLEESRNHGTRN